MLRRSLRIIAVTACAILLTGCAQAALVDFRPPAINDTADRTKVTEAVTYISTLSKKYLEAAGYMANDQQAFDLAIIAASTVAGASALFKWSDRILKDAALVAGGSYGIRSYYRGDEREDILISGVGALRCVKTVAAGLADTNANIVWEAVDDIERRVMERSIKHSAPDFSAIAKAMSAQAEAAQARKNAIHSLTDTQRNELDAPAKLTACVAKAG